MRSVLIELGPWSPFALPVVWAAVLAFVLLWQLLENRQSGQKILARDLLTSTGISLVAALVLYVLVNRYAPVSIKAYGVMMLVGYTVAAVWMYHAGRQDRLTVSAVIDMALLALLGGIVGGRVLYVILSHEEFTSWHQIFDLWSGGLSFHGGVIGGFVALWLYARHQGYRLTFIMDLFAMNIPIAYGFARIGCFLNGCCHGSPSDLPWAVVFPPGGACTLPGEHLHPTQLYATLLSWCIFGILVWLRPRMRREGHLFLAFLMLYSVMRFGLEFTRAGVSAEYVVPGGWLTVAQLASICIFAAAAIWMALTTPRGRREEALADDTRSG